MWNQVLNWTFFYFSIIFVAKEMLRAEVPRRRENIIFQYFHGVGENIISGHRAI